MPDNKKRNPLSPRLERIYSFLCEENDLLPSHAVLPSIRKIKRRFAVGQANATAISERLARRYGVTRQPKKRTRKATFFSSSPSGSAVRSGETVLWLTNESAPVWTPIVNEYNAMHKNRISVHYSPVFLDLQYLLHSPCFDFCLNLCNPVMLRFVKDTSSFLDLTPMLTEIDTTRYYPALTVQDHSGRTWGIAVNQITSALCCNQLLFKTPVRKYNWDEFLELLQEIRRKNYDGKIWPFLCSHYCESLFAMGIRLLDPDTLHFVPAPALKSALHFFKTLVDSGLTLPVSEVYPNREDLRLFYGNRIAIKEFNMPLLPVGRNYGILPLPTLPGHPNVANYEFFSIRSDSTKSRHAWDFIQFAISAKGQRMMALSSRTVPVMRGIAPAFLRKNEFRLFADYFENAVHIPEHTYFSVADRNILESAFDRCLRSSGGYTEFLTELEKSFCLQDVAEV